MFKKMDKYSLISFTLPIELQIIIINMANKLWYEENQKKIVKNWYRHIARKIGIFEISQSLKKISGIREFIDPIYNKNSDKIKYISKYFSGKIEDQVYWESILVKILLGIKLQFRKVFNKKFINLTNQKIFLNTLESALIIKKNIKNPVSNIIIDF